MNQLSMYFDRYGHRDTKLGTDKTTTHTYGQVYDFLVAQFEERATAILEIGFAGGFALQAYSEYFKNAVIHGIDLENNLCQVAAQNSRIKTYCGDARDPSTIQHFNARYDVIIEDASHVASDQIQHFSDYSAFVKPGGLYIVEDLMSEDLEEVREALLVQAHAIGFNSSLFDLRVVNGHGDNILMVFQKI